DLLSYFRSHFRTHLCLVEWKQLALLFAYVCLEQVRELAEHIHKLCNLCSVEPRGNRFKLPMFSQQLAEQHGRSRKTSHGGEQSRLFGFEVGCHFCFKELRCL